jgi:hypothetical protein
MSKNKSLREINFRKAKYRLVNKDGKVRETFVNRVTAEEWRLKLQKIYIEKLEIERI